MKNNLLTLGPLTVHGYGLMITIGVLAAYFVAEARAEKYGVKKDSVYSLVIWCAVGGILGAKLLYLITKIPDIIKNPSILLDVKNGFVVYGGIIGGIFCGYLYTRRTKQDFLTVFDLTMPSVALGQAFGRIGCFLAGCCYGRETSSKFHIIFHNSDFAPNNVALIPTQLISSGLDFLNFIVLIFFARKSKAKGQVAALYLMFYSAGRFVLEMYRGDVERGHVGVLSTSQFIAIFLEAIGIVLLVVCHKKYNGIQETTLEEISVDSEEAEESSES